MCKSVCMYVCKYDKGIYGLVAFVVMLTRSLVVLSVVKPLAEFFLKSRVQFHAKSIVRSVVESLGESVAKSLA